MNISKLLSRFIATTSVVCIAALASAATAQSFPAKPISVVFGGGTGTPVESAFRLIAAEAAKPFGQPVIWDSRPGANGRLSINALRSAPPDGHMLAMATDAILISQPLSDPEFQLQVGKHYAPVAFMLEFPSVLTVHPSTGAKDLKGLIAHAKANPGKLNIAGVAGGSGYFVAERFRQTTGINVTLVPYKGSPQALVDLVGGRVQAQFAPASAKQFIEAGKLVGIATTGSQRWSPFPDLPTLSEEGVPITTTFWYGLIAAAGTSTDVISRLNRTFNSILALPDLRKKLDADFGMTTGKHATPEEFAAFIRSETTVWGPIIKSAGIKLD